MMRACSPVLGLLLGLSSLRQGMAAMGTGYVSQPFSTDWVYASATFYDGPADFKKARITAPGVTDRLLLMHRRAVF